MKRYFPYLVIAITCLLAFLQVAILTQALKYDILDGYLPGHYFVSECLRNGIFPLWNPYQQLGYPVYADLLNTNYIVDMVFGRLLPYTNVTFHFLFIAYVIIAGIGFYKLCRQLNLQPQIALFASLAYALSGFITGNAQHIQFIVSAAWLPLVLFYFIRLAKKPDAINTFSLVLFTTLFVTGGYPSFAIFLAYLLVFFFLFMMIRLISRKEWKKLISFSITGVVSAMLILLLCSGMISSIIQSTPYVARFNGITYQYAITNSFTPEALTSLVMPFLTASHPEYFGTDMSMNNHYMSMIMLVFFIYGLFREKSVNSRILLIAGLITLLFSFGDHSFVHRLFYEHIPFFNKFRHPAAFRLFTIVFFLLFAGIQANKHEITHASHFLIFKKTYLAIMALIALVFGISTFVIIKKIAFSHHIPHSVVSLVADYGIAGPLFVQSALILFLNCFFIYFVLIRKKTSCIYHVLGCMLIAEVVLFTQLNLKYTVIADINPREISGFLRNQPAGFPLPDQHKLIDNTDESVSYYPLLYNTNIYSKTVSPYYKLYPFSLDGIKALEEDSGLFKNVIANPLVYFADTIMPLQIQPSVLPDPTLRYAFLQDSLYSIYSGVSFGHDALDTIECRAFSPQFIKYRITVQNPQLIILQQNDYPGWSVTMDGKRTGHFTVNRTLIGLMVPQGRHIITYEFRNPLYVKTTLFGFGIFVIILFSILTIAFMKEKNALKRAFLIAVTLLVIATIVFLVKPVAPFNAISNKSKKEINGYLSALIHRNPGKDIFYLFNVENPQFFAHTMHGSRCSYQRFRSVSDGQPLWNMLDTIGSNDLVYVWENVLEFRGLREIMECHFPYLVEEYAGKRFIILHYTKNPALAKDGGYSNKSKYRIPADSLSQQREYSTTFSVQLKDISSNRTGVFASVNFKTKDHKSVHLVITITRRGKTRYYETFDIQKLSNGSDAWSHGFIQRSWIRSSLKKGDRINVYCWNSGKNEKVLLKDFQVTIEDLH